jgi:hypothetical protein
LAQRVSFVACVLPSVPGLSKEQSDEFVGSAVMLMDGPKPLAGVEDLQRVALEVFEKVGSDEATHRPLCERLVRMVKTRHFHTHVAQTLVQYAVHAQTPCVPLKTLEGLKMLLVSANGGQVRNVIQCVTGTQMECRQLTSPSNWQSMIGFLKELHPATSDLPWPTLTADQHVHMMDANAIMHWVFQDGDIEKRLGEAVLTPIKSRDVASLSLALDSLLEVAADLENLEKATSITQLWKLIESEEDAPVLRRSLVEALYSLSSAELVRLDRIAHLLTELLGKTAPSCLVTSVMEALKATPLRTVMHAAHAIEAGCLRHGTTHLESTAILLKLCRLFGAPLPLPIADTLYEDDTGHPIRWVALYDPFTNSMHHLQVAPRHWECQPTLGSGGVYVHIAPDQPSDMNADADGLSSM